MLNDIMYLENSGLCDISFKFKLQKGFFIVRVLQMWTSIPQEVVLAESVDIFKKTFSCAPRNIQDYGNF